jgi:peptide deformylase
MASEVVCYGNKALRVKSEPVDSVNDDIKKLVKELLETMHVEKGLGLAAEQIGRSEAMCVIEIPTDYGIEKGEEPNPVSPGIGEPLVLINPEIISSIGEQSGSEGCLSFPGIYVTVKRAESVIVKYRSLDNEIVELQADGLLARAIQHELDHLNGILLVDHMSQIQKISVAGRLRRLKKENS